MTTPTINITLKKQHGAVLIISLLILIVLTIIGVTGMSNTNLEERMSHNFQHNTLAFQGAESAIQSVIISGNPESSENQNYDSANDPLVASINAGLNNTSTVVNDTISGLDTDINTSTTVVFVNAASCPGTSFGTFTCYVIEARATASIAATNTTTQHNQGIQRAGGEASSSNIIN